MVGTRRSVAGRQRMTEIFPIDDSAVQAARRVSFVLFFKTFPQAEALEKQCVVPH
jgi:hypothetical protein